jgi:hypothetical protein
MRGGGFQLSLVLFDLTIQGNEGRMGIGGGGIQPSHDGLKVTTDWNSSSLVMAFFFVFTGY